MYDVLESGVTIRHTPLVATPANGAEFLNRVKSNFAINILERPSPNELVFEMKGVDVSFANALRRIMIAEVPTVCIEHVYMWNNTSIVHDEVLAHRLGLVPIMVDPRKFDEFTGNDDEPTDRNTLVFQLNVSCGRSKAEDDRKERMKLVKTEKITDSSFLHDVSITGNTTLDQVARDVSTAHQSAHPIRTLEAIETPGRPYTRHVYSKNLKWVPQGDQEQRFPEGVRPIHEDILIAKLRPGQVIELEAHARKGVGKDHAKYSPVATAAYRLMPLIEIVNPVYDELAEQLVNLYEPGVFQLIPCDEPNHRVKAILLNPYACTMSRNYMRDPVLKESIKMSRIPDHFIFSIESVGMLPPGVILSESLKILQEKCLKTMSYIDESLEAEGLNE